MDDTGLIDVTDMPLAQLWALGEDTALDEALRRVLEPADGDELQPIAAFNSSL